MPQGPDKIETRIESLAEELAELRSRVRRLEEGWEAGGGPLANLESEDAALFPSLKNWGSAEIIGLAGRTLVILGGAFLLRAVSAAALLPDVSGPILGLVYAAWWLRQADLTGAAEERTSAFFYGLSGLVIAYPLIWEATARFHLLPGAVASPAIVVFLAAGLVVASRRSLPQLAWTVVLAALATTLALLVTTREFALYTGTILAIAAAVEAFTFRDRWPELRWPPAVVLNVTLLLMAMLVSRPRMSQEYAALLQPHAIVVASLLAPSLYLVSVATATLVRGRAISFFEIGQVAASLLCGIGTALVTMSFHGGDPTGIAASIAVLGVACYAVAFRSIDDEAHPRRNFYAYSSFAGVLVGVGTTLLLDGSVLALVWLALALTGIALGVHFQRNTLRLHGALYLAAAFAGSGLAAIGLGGLLGPLESLSPALTPVTSVIAAGSLAGYAILATRRASDDPHWTVLVPRLVVAAVSVWTVAGLAAPLLTGALLAVAGGLSHDLAHDLSRDAWLATTRTCVLSSFAAILAWAGRRWALEDLAWLVYPLMAANGARLLWEDLRYGEPINLFLALGFYGGALIATSRMLRKEA